MTTRIPEDLRDLTKGRELEEVAATVIYTNYKGETRPRKIIPLDFSFGSTKYHEEEQWLLRVWDLEKEAYRDYALKDIKEWRS